MGVLTLAFQNRTAFALVLALSDSQTASVTTLILGLFTAATTYLTVRMNRSDKHSTSLHNDFRTLWFAYIGLRDAFIGMGGEPPEVPRLETIPGQTGTG